MRHVVRGSKKITEVSQAEFDDLLEYSCTLPTGQAIGKMWKRSCGDGSWQMGRYYKKDDKYVYIEWRDLCIV